MWVADPAVQIAAPQVFRAGQHFTRRRAVASQLVRYEVAPRTSRQRLLVRHLPRAAFVMGPTGGFDPQATLHRNAGTTTAN